MPQINILLKLLNAAGSLINPATKEGQDALLAKLPSALSADRVKVETQHIQPLTEAQLTAAGLATETTADAIAAIVNASLNVALGTRATETSLLTAIAKLSDIQAACEAIAIDANTISLNADTINLNTDQLEAVMQQVRDRLPVALGQQLSAASLAVVLSTQQEAIFATMAGLLTDLKAGVGQQADAAATTDTGTFSLIALVKRALQNWTTLLARLPASLGQKASTASLPVALSSEQEALFKNELTSTNINIASGIRLDTTMTGYATAVATIMVSSGAGLTTVSITGHALPLGLARALGEVYRVSPTGRVVRITNSALLEHPDDGLYYHYVCTLQDDVFSIKSNGPGALNGSLYALRRRVDVSAPARAQLEMEQNRYRNMIVNPNAEAAFEATNWAITFTGTNPSLSVARKAVPDGPTPFVGRLTQGAIPSAGSTAGIIWGHRDDMRYAAQPGRRYVFECSLRALRAIADARAIAVLTNDVGGAAATVATITSPIIADLGPAAQFVRLRNEFTCPSNGSHVSFEVRCTADQSATGDLFEVTDVRYYEVPDASSLQLEELKALLPASLGQKASAQSLPVVLSSDLTYLDRTKIADRFTGEEYLEDQAGAGGVLTFTFANAPDIAFVFPELLTCRAAYSVTPTATKGVRCDAGVATPVILSGQTALKVFAPAGTSVSVWGFRYS